MAQQREPDSAHTTYRYLHLSLEGLAQLPPDELLQACLEARRLLDIILGVLYTADSHAMRNENIQLSNKEWWCHASLLLPNPVKSGPILTA